MNVLVTGATGFVAGHLIPRLVDAGYHVIASGHDPQRTGRFEGARPLVFDLRERHLPESFPLQVDVVVHLAQANLPFPDGAADLFEVNTGSTQRLLGYARRVGAKRFILASTGSVYGGGDRPWREDDPPNGAGFYAATKLAAERLVQAYADELPFTIFRLFAPYGPGQTGRLVPGLINRVRTGQPITLREGGRPRCNPTYVADVVEVLEQALSAEGNQVVNLGGDEVLSIRDMAETIGRALGRRPVFEDVVGATGGDVVGDTTLLRRLYRLPDRLTPFTEGVRAMVANEG